MKCAKCGAELKEGCLYCSVCGHEAQMVNGYSVLEEDYLKALLTDEASKDTSSEETENQKKKAEGVPVVKQKKNSFNNFHQRKYDYDELERQLINSSL